MHDHMHSSCDILRSCRQKCHLPNGWICLQGAIVVNVIDHKHPHSENDNEVEPSGELLPPDWAQHMGQNLPPAEPIGSDVGNPKVHASHTAIIMHSLTS